MARSKDRESSKEDRHKNHQSGKSTLIYNVGEEDETGTAHYGSISSKIGPDQGGSSGTGSESDLSDRSTTHCHESLLRQPDSNAKARKTLIIASGLCLFFMTVEIVGGSIAGSLAIMTDAAHLLSDFASFMISLVSLYLAARPATRRMSFGWHRAEVIGAVVSVLMIWCLTGVLVYVAIQRIIYKQYDIDATIMLVTASVGVVVNLVMGIVLHQGGHGHSHGGGSHSHEIIEHHHHIRMEHSEILMDEPVKNNETERGPLLTTTTKGKGRKSGTKKSRNINVRAALVHVIGDFIQSIGILIAALIIYFKPHLAIMDPICTFIFSILVLFTTITVMRDALNVLMEGLPRGISFSEVVRTLQSIDGVIKVHDLRIWSLTMDKVALSVHLAIDQHANAQEILRHATQLLRERFHVYECTVQIEHYSDAMNGCKNCETPIS